MTDAPFTSALRHELLKLLDLYKSQTGKSDSRISRDCFGSDSEFVARVRRGQDIYLSRAMIFEGFLRRRIAETRPRPSKAA
jgi:hypothetical protein